MPRYLVERRFDSGLHIPATTQGAEQCHAVVSANAREGVTWLHSYVSQDRRRSFCVYDAPDPEAIREHARRAGIPVDVISEVSLEISPAMFR